MPNLLEPRRTVPLAPVLLAALLASACQPVTSEEEAAGSVQSALSGIHFQNGVAPTAAYAGATDAVLREASASAAGGSEPSLTVDRDEPSGSHQSTVALLRFDLGSIPPGSAVQSVGLTLNVTNRTSGEGYTLYEVKRRWSDAQATWTQAANGTAWSAPGARGSSDRGAALATVLPTATGTYAVALNADGVAAVKRWIDDPASNFGFILDAASNMDGLVFDSSEAVTAGHRPELVVAYTPPASGGTGLLGQYYRGTAFQTLVTTRTDATVDFSWGAQAPPGSGLPTDGFSVRWSGQLVPLYSERYTFFTTSDDGVRLWVDGQLIIDHWNSHGAVEDSGTVSLTAGKKVDLKLEYFDGTGSATIQLAWASAHQAKQIVPAAQLFPAAPTGFVHPGIVVGQAQLDFVKARIAEGAEPWTSLLAKAKSSKYGKLDYTPHAFAEIQCGNGTRKDIQIGCDESRDDALAAYTLALIGACTGDVRYAQKASAILDLWSSTLTTLRYDGTDATGNDPLQASWLAELFPRSAEILRHTDSGWPAANAQRFGQMLSRVLLPRIVDGWSSGGSNWNASMASGVINIGVYNDDRATFDQGVALWRTHLREAFYLTSDGPWPIPQVTARNADGSWKSGELQRNWWGQVEFGQTRENGMVQETCRDLSHSQMTLASYTNGAETALLQGLDLYSEGQARLLAAHEFLAKQLNAANAWPVEKDVATASWLCGGTLKTQDDPTWEIAYHHFVHDKHLAMPESAQTIARFRRAYATAVHATVNGQPKDVYMLPYTNLQMAWESLTHGVADSEL